MLNNENQPPIIVSKIYRRIESLFYILYSKYPIGNKKNNISCAPFLIIGSGRSGNTLLRAILVSNPKIAIPPESFVLHRIVKKFQAYSFLPWRELVKLIVGEFESSSHFFTWEINMYGVYDRLFKLDKEKRTLANIIDEIFCYYSERKFPNFEIWGDKTPLNTLHLDLIDNLFDNAKYINLIRDGRDVVSSYLKMGRYASVEEAAYRWKRSIELARKFGKNKSKNEYIEIRYEKLVSNPSNEIKKICEFLNVGFHKDMIEHQKIANELSDVKQMPHYSNVKNPINTDSIGKWKRNLSDEQRIKVEELLNDKLKELNYK